MRAGRLGKRVEILEPRETKNSVGEVVTTWRCLRTIWADIEPIRGEERWTVMQAKGTADVKITARASAAKTITPKMRLQYTDRTGAHFYDVDSNIQWRMRGVFSEIYCKESA